MTLLGPHDPPPVEVLCAEGAAPMVIAVDHAGAAVPEALGRLGLADEVFGQHVAVDLGAAALARALGEQLEAPTVLATYSRLVVDVNRVPTAESAVALMSDGITVPGNHDLDPADRRARFDEIFTPYHDTLAATLAAADERAGRSVGFVALHSFTPTWLGDWRPWDCGVMWREDPDTAMVLRELLVADGLSVGDNEPYSMMIDDSEWYSVPRHADAVGRPHALLEIRQDRLATPTQIAEWTERLARVFAGLFPREVEVGEHS